MIYFIICVVIGIGLIFYTSTKKDSKKSKIKIDKSKMIDNKDLTNLDDFSHSKIDFDDLDEETKKAIENQTLFVDEDGAIDGSRGLGKILTNEFTFSVDVNEDGVSWTKTKPDLVKDNSTKSNLEEKELITTIFNEANKFQDENNHEEAIRCYKKIIFRLKDEKFNIANNNFIIEQQIATPVDGVYFNLGQSYLALQEFTEAKKAFEKAIEINPYTQAMFFHHLGVTKILLGDFTTCIEDFNNSLKIDENHFDSYYMRAVAYGSEDSELQDINMALEDLKIYLKKYPEDSAANKLLDLIS